ncbi:Flp family type IVb pilin [Pseudorhodoplanes sp.]|uniref:Flp family type IVb pilin n=1 Tax=Pseudorhodoplanes sp. TaxID=1934341 RepID=UPI002B5DBC1A|nr:Flp family type IVb pilin [Pseudorhodoplanes sp.]HWV53453.1 Flp family type IVb pilin [Pseudorhodoplanes sp.]
MGTQEIYVRTFRHFLRDERGATAIEYAMIAAGIAVAIVAAVNSLGVTVVGLFQSVQSAWPT